MKKGKSKWIEKLGNSCQTLSPAHPKKKHFAQNTFKGTPKERVSSSFE